MRLLADDGPARGVTPAAIARADAALAGARPSAATRRAVLAAWELQQLAPPAYERGAADPFAGGAWDYTDPRGLAEELAAAEVAQRVAAGADALATRVRGGMRAAGFSYA